MTFEETGLSPELLAAITERGFEKADCIGVCL